MEKNEKIRFKNLSFPCKMGIIMGWVVGLVYTSAILIGLIVGIISVAVSGL